MLWLYLACKEKWEEIVDTKKVGGDGGGRCWNSLLGGKRSSNPLAHKISITLHRQGGKREPRSPRSCILGGGEAWDWQLRPPLATTWPLHGPYMAPTRLQHGRNKQNDELAFWLFYSEFLAEASKKIELDV
jgi:hypothetical protein